MKKLLTLIAMACATTGAWAADIWGYATSDETGIYMQADKIGDTDNYAIISIQMVGTNTKIVIPATIYCNSNTYNVTQVGIDATFTFYKEWDNEGKIDVTSQVTTIEFADGITTIGQSAFLGLSNLQELIFPSSLTTIGNYAFQKCDGLTSITSYANELTLGTEALNGNSSWDYIAKNCVLKVKEDCAENYAKQRLASGDWTIFDTFYDNKNIHEMSWPKISSIGYGTYYNTYAYKMPEKVEGYAVKSAGSGALNLVKVYNPGDVVEAGLPLLWKYMEAMTEDKYPYVEIYRSGDDVDWPSAANDNKLSGSQTEGNVTAWGSTEDIEYAKYKFYKLANETKGEARGLGWYYGADDGGKFTTAAHKAYLILPIADAGASARSFLPLFVEEETGINAVETKDAEGEYYNLAGQRVAQPTKGMFIVNGKKVIFK